MTTEQEKRYEQMLNLHSKIGGLEERTKNFETRLTGFEASIDARLKKIDEDLKKSNIDQNEKLENIDSKINSILDIQSQMKGSKKTLLFIGSTLIIASAIFTWFLEHFERLRGLFL